MRMEIDKIARLRLIKAIVGIIVIIGLLIFLFPSSPFFFMKVLTSSNSDQMILIQRYSNHSDGIEILQDLEMRDLFNEAKEINSSCNQFQNSTVTSKYDFCTINQSTIEYYNHSLDKDESKARYFGYIWSFNNQILTELTIESLIGSSDVIDDPLFNFAPTIPIQFDKLWIITQELASLNFSEGWIVFQQLEFGFLQKQPYINGQGEIIRQISVLDSSETLLWMASYSIGWMVIE